MTKIETLKLMATLRAAYPQYYAKVGLEDAEITAALWQRMFQDDDAGRVGAAVAAFIASDASGFPPSIGQIKDKLDKIRQEAEGHDLTPAEAWGLVAKACRRATYNAQEEYDKLPDTVRAVLGGAQTLHDYAQMDLETLNSVVASNFQRSYAARASYVAEMRKWPKEVKALIASERFKAIGAWEQPKELDEAKGGNAP